MVFIPNPAFIKELQEQPDTAKALAQAAEKAAPKAEAFVGDVMPSPGRRRIEVVEEDGEILLVNTNYGAQIEEFGSKNNPPYSPLRRGVRAAGFRLKES